MIFTLVSAVQEKLNEIVDQIKTRREEEKKQKEREAEEEEKVCKIRFSTKKFLSFFKCVGLMQRQFLVAVGEERLSWSGCNYQNARKRAEKNESFFLSQQDRRVNDRRVTSDVFLTIALWVHK